MSIQPYGAYLAGPQEEGKRVEINVSHLHDLIRDVLQNVAFDEQWYCGYYRDVSRAIDAGELKSGQEHYIRVGYFEDRRPRPIEVDQEWYLAAYTDVVGAIRRGNVSSAQEHFENYGFAEGRLPQAGWKL